MEGSIAIVDPGTPNPDIETATDHFEKYRGRFLGIALRYAQARDLTEDIVQQVYLEFVANYHRWDLDGDIGALLNVMARNFARRLWQDRIRLMPEKRRELALRLLALSESRPENQEGDSCEEEIEHLKTCLERLPENERQLFETTINGIEKHYCSEECRKHEKEQRRKARSEKSEPSCPIAAYVKLILAILRF